MCLTASSSLLCDDERVRAHLARALIFYASAQSQAQLPSSSMQRKFFKISLAFANCWAIVLCVLLQSCAEPGQKYVVVSQNDTLVLNTPWKYRNDLSGQYADPTTRARRIYSGDINTYLTIRVFNDKGDSLYEVPLKEATDALDDINSLTMFDDGKLFLIEEHGPHFAILDKLGRLVRKGSLATALCPTPNDQYEVSGYFNGMPSLGNTVYMSASCWGVCGQTGPDPSMTQIQHIQDHHLQNARKCRMAKLNLSNDTAMLLFGGCNVVPHLADTPRFASGGLDRYIANNRLFLTTAYAPYILHVDTGTLEVLNRIPIDYVNGPAGIMPPPLTVEDMGQDRMNVRSATKAKIVGFAYDQPSNHYVVTVMHAVPEKLPEEETGRNRPWSLIVLDSEFKKVAEHVVPGKLYMPYHLISTEHGTYVRRAKPGREDFTGYKVFCRLMLL